MVRLLTLAAALLALAAPVAAAHGPGIDTAVGKNDGRLPNGLYKVTLDDGAVVYTHGDDPKPLHGTDMNAGDAELAPVCATTNAQQVLYAYSKASGNRLSTMKASLQAQVRRNTHVLDESAKRSGGVGARYRVVCDGAGAISVLAYQVKSGTSFNSITNGARQAGHKRTDVDYTIFFDGTSATACGVGSFYSDERPGAENYNNRGGAYAVSYRDCWYGRTSMHESGHNQGAVQASAPFSTGTGAHCYDLLDVMCYSPDGGNLHQEGTVTLCSTAIWFDCNDDTYFDAAPEAGEWLSTHWNLGGPNNRYVDLSATS
jgi:hypothetical protein